MSPKEPSQRLLALIVASALFMENLDSTILATALPAIARSFEINPLHLSLAISSYLLSLAIFVPISGYAADRYGARVVFRAAIVTFTLGSIACGLAPNAKFLVIARALQGIGGAMMVPVGRLVVLRRLPKDQLVSAMAWITIPALVAPIVAPLVGGLIATYADWRWIFFINVPIGVVGWWLATRHVHDAALDTPRPMDWPGWLLLGTGLALLVLGFEFSGKGLVPRGVVPACLGLGALALVGYVRRSRRTAHPIIDLSLLRIRTFRTALIGGNLFRIAAGATTLLNPLMLQVGFGLSAAQSGALTFAGAVGALTMRTQVATLLKRLGFRWLLMADAAVSALLIGLCALLRPSTPHLLILALFLVIGFSRSLLFTSVNTLTYADVSTAQMSHATSFSSTVQQVTLSLGVACAAQLLHATALWRGAALPGPADFAPAFLVLALSTLACVVVFRRLSPDAGANVSGHRVTTR